MNRFEELIARQKEYEFYHYPVGLSYLEECLIVKAENDKEAVLKLLDEKVIVEFAFFKDGVIYNDNDFREEVETIKQGR